MKIDYLDNIISFNKVMKLSNIFTTGGIIITFIIAFISFIFTFVNFKNMMLFLRIITITFTCFIMIAGIVLSIFVNNGRYVKQSCPNIEEGFTYFGTTNNEKPHGWGKLFDANNDIYYVGDFSNGLPDGKGKYYKKTRKKDKNEQNIMFVYKEGEFSQGKGEGHVVVYDIINDEKVEIYNGEMLNDEKSGQGIYYEYQDDKLVREYNGSWAYDKMYGYGTSIGYDESGNICERYRGTFLDNLPHGKNIWEYLSDTKKVVRVGEYYNPDENGVESEYTEVVYYHGEDKSLWGYIDGTEGFTSEDPSYLEELSNKWPYPEETIWD